MKLVPGSIPLVSRWFKKGICLRLAKVHVCAHVLVNHLEHKACPEISVSRSTNRLHMTLTVMREAYHPNSNKYDASFQNLFVWCIYQNTFYVLWWKALCVISTVCIVSQYVWYSGGQRKPCSSFVRSRGVLRSNVFPFWLIEYICFRNW